MNLRQALIRLANEQPETRKDILPLLKEAVEQVFMQGGFPIPVPHDVRIPRKGMFVVVGAGANPDFTQAGDPSDTEGNYDWNREREPKAMPVRTVKDAIRVCRDYMHKNELGGGNWIGGQIYQDGNLIGYVSANGRYWPAIARKNASFDAPQGAIIAKPKRDIRMLKDGKVITQGITCKIEFNKVQGRPGSVMVTPQEGQEANASFVLRAENLYKYFPGFTNPPSVATMERWSDNGIGKTITGKRTEPDGYGPDGSPSWLLILGLV